mmetsp:Transcript_44073/g.60190  ORF Transcript_44073/g.60190 Transcript_44073/m.60190 type:complete len:404 (-) Transcript_44073:581-1792(-)
MSIFVVAMSPFSVPPCSPLPPSITTRFLSLRLSGNFPSVAVHTKLRYFKGCSKNFLFGALEHSVRSLKNCGIVERNDISPSDFTLYVAPLINLRVLDLSACVQLDRSSFALVASSFPKLEVLYLKQLPNLDDASIAEISRTHPRITLLDLSMSPMLTGKAIRAVGQHLNSLRMLNISDVGSLDAEDLGPLFKRNEFLHTLSLRKCHMLRAILPRSSSDSLPSLANMECLNLSDCHELTDAALRPLCFATRLRNLNLSYCHRITDVTIQFLGSFCRSLEHLDVSYARRLTDKSLGDIARGLTSLRSLALNHCGHLSTTAVIALVEKLLYLTEVRLMHCKQINAHELLPLIHRTLRLDIIDLRGCRFLSQVGVNKRRRSTSGPTRLDPTDPQKLFSPQPGLFIRS